MAYRLGDVVLTVGCTSLFKVFVLFAAPLFYFGSYPTPSQMRYIKVEEGERKGVGGGAKSYCRTKTCLCPYQLRKRGINIILVKCEKMCRICTHQKGVNSTSWPN
jgi:hypothetical protein